MTYQGSRAQINAASASKTVASTSHRSAGSGLTLLSVLDFLLNRKCASIVSGYPAANITAAAQAVLGTDLKRQKFGGGSNSGRITSTSESIVAPTIIRSAQGIQLISPFFCISISLATRKKSIDEPYAAIMLATVASVPASIVVMDIPDRIAGSWSLNRSPFGDLASVLAENFSTRSELA